MTQKIITVVGATGAQGRGVVAAFIGNEKFKVRAITRRPLSEAAEKLREKGAEVVQADINDVQSLKAAFAGSHVIYGITDFFEPFAKGGPEHGMEIEVQQGINLATAAAATSTLESYIWSTLPHGMGISNGKYLIPHFEGKNRIDAFIRSHEDLLAKTTFLWVTWYHNNFSFPMFTPYYIPTAGKYVQFATHSPNTPITTIGDVSANVGPFVEAIVAQPGITRNGAIVQASIGETTADALLQTWAKVNDKEALIARTDVDTYNAMWPLWAAEMGVMMRFWDEYKEKSWTAPGKTVLTRKELAIDETRFVQLEEAFKGVEY